MAGDRARARRDRRLRRREVNNATVTCGNLHTANATVYVINAVLMPAR